MRGSTRLSLRERRATSCAIATVALWLIGGAGEHPSPDKAEEQFREGVAAMQSPAQARVHFRRAAVEYQRVAKSGTPNADLYFNLGNAYFLADEMPRAILAYREGLRLNPVHARLWENLEAVRDQVGYPGGLARHRPAPDAWPFWLPRPSPDLVLRLALCVNALAWAGAWLWLVLRGKKLAALSLLLFLVTAMFAGLWGYLDYQMDRAKQQDVVVVTQNGTALRRGNGVLYPRHPELPIVNRGMEAVRLHERGGWVQVQFPGGEIGWLPRTAVLD
jgi:tetratricopeptide (TPR) repeat protein